MGRWEDAWAAATKTRRCATCKARETEKDPWKRTIYQNPTGMPDGVEIWPCPGCRADEFRQRAQKHPNLLDLETLERAIAKVEGVLE